MPKKQAPKLLQILDENGNLSGEIPQGLTVDDIKKIYELMILTRTFDETCLALQREGRILTYASTLGQEAQVAAAYALQKQDWFIPSFREHGVFFTRGYPIEKYLLYWAGDERGMQIPENINCLPICVPVSTQIPHAVGIAWAAKMRKEKTVVAVFFGDGATSKGDFHEAMNWAGVFKIPCIFICQNNQWAISMPRSKQTAAETIAQKAIAYGFEGIQVDGNDVFAVYKATKYAADKARAGNGPTLIELYTYRLSDHTTADDAKRYRDPKEVEEWKKKDPILRLRKFLQNRNWWSEEWEKKILQNAKQEVDAAVKSAESLLPPKPEEMFTSMYAKLPKNLEEEMEEAKCASS
jgi:pyruvate dehydrogenase E1 component alpha subunit